MGGGQGRGFGGGRGGRHAAQRLLCGARVLGELVLLLGRATRGLLLQSYTRLCKQDQRGKTWVGTCQGRRRTSGARRSVALALAFAVTFTLALVVAPHSRSLTFALTESHPHAGLSHSLWLSLSHSPSRCHSHSRSLTFVLTGSHPHPHHQSCSCSYSHSLSHSYSERDAKCPTLHGPLLVPKPGLKQHTLVRGFPCTPSSVLQARTSPSAPAAAPCGTPRVRPLGA